MDQQDEQFAAALRLSARRALLGQVPSSLRAVSLEMRDTVIHFRAVFEPGTSEADREFLSVAATEIVADFTAPVTIQEEYIELAPPAEPLHLRHLVFSRSEAGTVRVVGSRLPPLIRACRKQAALLTHPFNPQFAIPRAVPFARSATARGAGAALA
ncbi:MAG: hypothetical protein QM770_10255 [Tepidisphaeraceae bacterium]